MDINLWKQLGFDEQQQQWQNNKYAFNELAMGANVITGATVLMNAALKQTALPFLQLPKEYFHDAYLGLLATSKNGLYSLNSPLISYRIHPKQQVGIGDGVFLKAPKMKVDRVSLNRFFKDLSKRIPFRFKLILGLVKYRKAILNIYSNLPEKNPFKKLYCKVFK